MTRDVSTPGYRGMRINGHIAFRSALRSAPSGLSKLTFALQPPYTSGSRYHCLCGARYSYSELWTSYGRFQGHLVCPAHATFGRSQSPAFHVFYILKKTALVACSIPHKDYGGVAPCIPLCSSLWCSRLRSDLQETSGCQLSSRWTKTVSLGTFVYTHRYSLHLVLCAMDGWLCCERHCRCSIRIGCDQVMVLRLFAQATLDPKQSDFCADVDNLVRAHWTICAPRFASARSA